MVPEFPDIAYNQKVNIDVTCMSRYLSTSKFYLWWDNWLRFFGAYPGIDIYDNLKIHLRIKPMSRLQSAKYFKFMACNWTL